MVSVQKSVLRPVVLFMAGIAILAMTGCGKDSDEPAPPKPPVDNPQDPEKPNTGRWIVGPSDYVFDFRGQARYSYCPCPIENPDGSVDVFFCGNPTPQVMIDNIYHISLNAENKLAGNAVSVLQPGQRGTWDDQHVCDPSVIEGKFSFGGTDYRDAMIYLGCSLDTYYNEIGVAFANDLNSAQWVKYPRQVITKPWDAPGDQELGNGVLSWGVGQPSALSLDKAGKVLLSYTIGDKDGTRIVMSTIDMSVVENLSVSDPVKITHAGLKTVDNQRPDFTCNSEMALDEQNSVIVMIRPVQPHSTVYPAYINSILEIDHIGFSEYCNAVGSWIMMARITPDDTGYARNHNAAILRDSFGRIPDWKKPEFFYTVSKEYPDVDANYGNHAEWSYRIYRSYISQ